MGGFRPKEYTIFCAPTGIGKTQWLANLSVHLITQNIKHMVYSVETGHEDYVQRMMSSEDGYKYNSGHPVPKEKIEIFDKQHGGKYGGTRMWIGLYENRIKVETLIKDIEKVVALGCQLVIIDNLNFILEPVNATNSLLEIDRVTHELILVCKRLDVHIIMVQHPKKTESGRVQNEFDIKGSSTAVQEAHNVFVLNRVTYDDARSLPNSSPTDRELLFIKLRRRGESVGRKVYFSFKDGKYFEVAHV